MQFQILDVDYVFVNDKPILRVFGKTEKGESVCGFYEGLLPFFYAEGKGVEELLAKNPQVAKIETVSRFVVGSQAPRDVYRITLRNPAKTPEVREGLTAAGVKAYEADILFKYRVMNDLGLDGLGWVEVSGSNGVTTETVNAKLKLQIKDIKPVLKDADVGLKYMAFDIECTSSKGGLPDSKRDPIILISLVFSEPFKGEKSIVLSTRADPSVLHSEDEKAMLEEFIRIIDEYDPDIITGYNCNNFDLPYIVGRMREAGVRPLFGRCKQKQVISKKIGMKQKTIITGRIVADSFDIVKKDFSLQRYGLDFVADKLLGEKKGAVKHSEIEKLWKGDQPGFKKLAEYCKQDSVLALNLLLKLNLLDKYTALSKVSGTLLQDTLDSGETTRIENYVLREFNKAGYVFPCRPDARAVLARGEGRHDALGGGAVLEPDKGIHSSVIVLDFKAMYPSIVRTFNICPTTLIDKPVEGCM
ncbi:MAG: 3'-5' exonuclease, partial [Candidatus Aenigmatarchaeota archaeon]